MREYLAELHIHTVLSPCGDLLMTPANILQYAAKRKIELLGITDHNSAENVAVIVSMAPQYGIHVLPGMEIETKEEVHLIALFDTLEQVLAMQELVYRHLPPLENDENFFGPQLICDLADEYVDRVTRLLAVAVSLSLEEVVAAVKGLGGLAYPAHVDRQRNSILTQLGFIPPDLQFPALEVSSRFVEQVSKKVAAGEIEGSSFEGARQQDKGVCTNCEKAQTGETGHFESFEKMHNDDSEVKWAQMSRLLADYPLIPASDAHYLDDLRGPVVFTLEKPGIAELRMALSGEGGRSFHWRR